MPNPDTLIKVTQIVMVILCFLVVLICALRRKEKPDLANLMVAGISGASIPMGAALVWAAFDLEVLNRFSQSPIYVAFAGCAVLYIAVRTVWEKL
jgi:hypothetical protein